MTIEIVDGIKTTRKGKLTIVELPDGSRGASKCLPTDNMMLKEVMILLF